MATTTRKQTEITSATVNRVIDKATKKVLGYLVKSDSEQGVWYQVTWDRENHRYNCTCPATKPCKHERAVSETVKARKEIEAAEKQQAVAEAEKIVTSQPVAAIEEPTTQPTTQRYCDACICVGKLQLIDGLMLCAVCAEQTRPAIIEPPTTVAATKPLATAKKAPPATVNRGSAQMGNNKVFSITR